MWRARMLTALLFMVPCSGGAGLPSIVKRGSSGPLADPEFGGFDELSPGALALAREAARQDAPTRRGGKTNTVTFKLPVTFKVVKRTSWGEVVKIVGSSKQLGAWDAHKAPTMTTDEYSYPVWTLTTDVEMQPGTQYKFATVGPHGVVTWEPLKDNRQLSSDAHGVVVNSVFGSVPSEDEDTAAVARATAEMELAAFDSRASLPLPKAAAAAAVPQARAIPAVADVQRPREEHSSEEEAVDLGTMRGKKETSGFSAFLSRSFSQPQLPMHMTRSWSYSRLDEVDDPPLSSSSSSSENGEPPAKAPAAEEQPARNEASLDESQVLPREREPSQEPPVPQQPQQQPQPQQQQQLPSSAAAVAVEDAREGPVHKGDQSSSPLTTDSDGTLSAAQSSSSLSSPVVPSPPVVSPSPPVVAPSPPVVAPSPPVVPPSPPVTVPSPLLPAVVTSRAPKFCNGEKTAMFTDGLTSVLWATPAVRASRPCAVFLIRAWSLNTPGRFFFGCIGAILLGLSAEGMIALRRILMQPLDQKPPPGLAAAIALHALSLAIGYALMLLVMLYCVEIALSVVLGVCLGRLLFSYLGLPAAAQPSKASASPDVELQITTTKKYAGA